MLLLIVLLLLLACFNSFIFLYRFKKLISRTAFLSARIAVLFYYPTATHIF
nr:MAG TPA: hypothetical protein [Caudoviricetes sp.]